MTPALERELNELDRLCKEATPGPWVPSATDVNGPHGYVCYAGTIADAGLIAAARNALPAITAEVRRLDAIETAAREMRREALGYEDESKRYASEDSFLQARRRYNAARSQLDALLDVKKPAPDGP